MFLMQWAFNSSPLCPFVDFTSDYPDSNTAWRGSNHAAYING